MRKLYIFITLITIPLFSKDESNSYSIYMNKFDLLYNSIIDLSNIANSFFPDTIFKNKIEKIKYFSELDAIFYAYKDQFYKIELAYKESNYDTIFYIDEDNKFYFSDAKEYNEDKNLMPHIYFYPKTNKDQYRFSKFFSRNRKKNNFLNLIYGVDPKEVWDNLIDVNIFGRILPFNSKNGASKNLEKAIREIELISEINDDVNEWIKSIKNISTYINRKIDKSERDSTHSLGIAVDFIPKNNKKQIYWLWSRMFFPEWWNIKDE
jgi:hypothetical protein